MQRCSLTMLSQLSDPITLFVHSSEGDIYTATCELATSELAVIYDDTGAPLMARSLQKIRKHFGQIALNKAYLVQRSAYDEMIGTQTVSEPMKTPLHW